MSCYYIQTALSGCNNTHFETLCHQLAVMVEQYNLSNISL